MMLYTEKRYIGTYFLLGGIFDVTKFNSGLDIKLKI